MQLIKRVWWFLVELFKGRVLERPQGFILSIRRTASGGNMIRCTWTAPTEHTSGKPAKAGDLTGYSLRMKVDGAPSFTEIAKPKATEVQFEVDVSDPGTYSFELVALSSNGKTSAPASGSVTIADETPLKAPVLTVALA